MATIDDLKAKLAEAMKVYGRIRDRAALAQRAGLGNQYQTVVGRFSAIVERVTAATKATSFTDAVKALWSGDKTSGMGIVPLVVAVPWIAGTAIAGLVALIASWLVDAYELDRRLSAAEEKEKRGVPSDQAADDVAKAAGDGKDGKKSNSKGLLDDAKSLLGIGLAIATVVVAGPPLVRAFSNSNNRNNGKG